MMMMILISTRRGYSSLLLASVPHGVTDWSERRRDKDTMSGPEATVSVKWFRK